MTEHEKKEIEEFLLAKGLSKTAVKVALNSAELDSLCEQYKNSDEGKRYQELCTFEPNPGEAQLTPVGKVHEGITYLEDPSPNSDKQKMFRSEYEVKKTDGNIPVYQEDIDMVKKAIPLAKKIVDMQKKRDDVGAVVADAYNLPQGPDTTENIREVLCTPTDDERKVDYQFYWDDEGNSNKNVFKAAEKYVPKPGTKGMMKVQPTIFDHILEQMSEVHRKKNADYGDAAYEGYKEFGIQYYIIQLHNKLTRLKSLTKEGYQPQVSESIEDTLLDMANYAVLALEALKRED